MPDETDIEDLIAQAIKDYFLDNHGFDVGYWEGFVAEWIDTGQTEFDAQAMAENIVERLRQAKTVIFNVP